MVSWLKALCFSHLACTLVRSLNPLVIRGNKIYDSVTKVRFFIKGVTYQPTYVGNGLLRSDLDTIQDLMEKTWRVSLPHLRDLGVNTVRVYNVNPVMGHGLFMKACEELGIYVMVAVTTPYGPGALNASLPSPACFTPGLLKSAKEIVSAFARFPNLLAFVVGNEVGYYDFIRGNTIGLQAVPCVKALVRDLHAYMHTCSCSMRSIPLIYAGTDLSEQVEHGLTPRMILSSYLSCDENALDMIGVNIYTWCSSEATWDKRSTYHTTTEQYGMYEIPAILTEFGCILGDFASEFPWKTNQRTWKQVDALFTDMSDVFSGGLAYDSEMKIMYRQTSSEPTCPIWNNYGLSISRSLCFYAEYTQSYCHKSTPFHCNELKFQQDDYLLLEGYFNLQEAYSKVLPPLEVGSWSEHDLCQWKPTNIYPKSQPVCPTHEEVQAIFDYAFAKYNMPSQHENWLVPLPPTPSFSEKFWVGCPNAQLSSSEKLENKCKSSCPCDAIVPNPTCMVLWNTPPSPEDSEHFFGTLCGLIAQYGGDYAETCTKDLSPKLGGRFAMCTLEKQANYLLGVWNIIKDGKECCDVLQTSSTFECRRTQSQPLSFAEKIFDQRLGEGDRLVLSINVMGGSLDYTYRWFVGLNVIPLTQSFIYVLDKARVSDAGTYRVEVSDGETVISSSALVTITMPPKNNSHSILPDPIPVECAVCENGDCNSTAGRCVCYEGYFGEGCYLKECRHACLNGGQCDPREGQCGCAKGFNGISCEEMLCTHPCVNGKCDLSQGRCFCSEEYVGEDCSVQVWWRKVGVLIGIGSATISVLVFVVGCRKRLRSWCARCCKKGSDQDRYARLNDG